VSSTTPTTCSDCGYTLFVFADGSALCPICYVHGAKKAQRIAAQRRESYRGSRTAEIEQLLAVA
jgi:uncharacterized Zn finger protein (UPF0148 family)